MRRLHHQDGIDIMQRPDDTKFYTSGNIQCADFKALKKFIKGEADVHMDDLYRGKKVIVDGFEITYY